jgi:hypothetical protein
MVFLIRGMATFFSLPIELRNIIYSMILISSHNIKICSLPGKYLWDRGGHKKPRFRKIFGQLLCVNKQVYKEGSLIFYSKNTFTIGTGPYGSTRIPNLHGLRSFLQRVPWKHTSFINKLKVVFVLEL